jgi:hypothetical protein
LGIGASALVWTQKATRTYGIPSDDLDAQAYVRAVAARDLVMGLIVLKLSSGSSLDALKAALLSCAVAPIADFVLAKQRRGNIPQLAIHASGVVGIATVWGLLTAGL